MENPALRLHEILTVAYNSSEPIGYNNYPNFRTVWGSVFDVDRDDTSALMFSFTNMLNLVSSLKNLVEKNDEINDNVSKNVLSKINIALSNIDFENDIRHFYSNMDTETLTSLHFIGKLIDFAYKLNSSTIDKDKIQKLLQSIDELLENISESTLPERAVQLLVRNLHSMREALINYKFFGEEALIRSLEQTIGSMVLNQEITNEIPKDDKNYKKFFEIFIALGSITAFGSSILEIASPIIEHILIP